VGEIAREPETLAEAGRRCDAYLADPHCLEPNLADPVVNLAARQGDAALYERFLTAASEATTPQEQRRFLFALGAFEDAALVRRTLDRCLTDAVGTQDVAILLTRMFSNPQAALPTWEFMKRHWKRLRRRLPPMLITRPIEATPALASRAMRRDVAAFFRANPVSTGARAVRQALEQFDLSLACDAREQDRLANWLAQD
jgi:hypothetical protein